MIKGRSVRRTITGLAGVGAVLLGYGVLEARSYRVRTYTIPLLPPGSPEIKILQVSDFHLRPRNRKMVSFLESLAGENADLLLATGDLLGDPESMAECLRLLNGMRGRTRAFVFGSADYYAPVLKNYFDYFLGRRKVGTERNPTRRFRWGLVEEGWIDLNNHGVVVNLGGLWTQVTGLDDPYLHRDDRRLLVRDPSAELAILVVHDPAPYDDALKAGYDLVVAGHTHGGQVRIPFAGALVTNSTLPTDLARGLSELDGGWLFVSPGLGTGKYARFRFLCPPEASVLKLVSRSP